MHACEAFKESVQLILDEFEGKNLLHQNVGQLVWEWEKSDSGRKDKFEMIWLLLEQVSPRIISDFNSRMRRSKG